MINENTPSTAPDRAIEQERSAEDHGNPDDLGDSLRRRRSGTRRRRRTSGQGEAPDREVLRTDAPRWTTRSPSRRPSRTKAEVIKVSEILRSKNPRIKGSPYPENGSIESISH